MHAAASCREQAEERGIHAEPPYNSRHTATRAAKASLPMQNLSPGDSSNPCTPVLEGLAGHAQSFQVTHTLPCRLACSVFYAAHTYMR